MTTYILLGIYILGYAITFYQLGMRNSNYILVAFASFVFPLVFIIFLTDKFMDNV